MIVTDLKHIEKQASNMPHLKKIAAFLHRPDLHALPDGRVELDGDRVYASVQRYDSMIIAAPKFEHHRKYIDVQFIVSGEETIGWAPAERMTITEAYDPDKDICFGPVKGLWTPVKLQTGQVAVLWPEDGHAPKLAIDAPARVMKIVVKVAV